jgi:hypothetical protein
MDAYGFVTINYAQNEESRRLETLSWSDVFLVDFDWYSVDQHYMQFESETISHDSKQTVLKVDFSQPQFVSNYNYDKLIVTDGY